MAKEVTHAVTFRDPVQQEIGPDRYLFVVACDDGSLYVFQRLDDHPLWNLRARGSVDEEPRHWTTRSAPLPANVEETLNEHLGEKRWTK